MRQQVKNNFKEIQKIIDERPYNFGFIIINKWVEAKSEFEKSDAIEKITDLMGHIMTRTTVFENVYWKEVLGMEMGWKWKIEDYLEEFSSSSIRSRREN